MAEEVETMAHLFLYIKSNSDEYSDSDKQTQKYYEIKCIFVTCDRSLHWFGKHCLMW